MTSYTKVLESYLSRSRNETLNIPPASLDYSTVNHKIEDPRQSDGTILSLDLKPGLKNDRLSTFPDFMRSHDNNDTLKYKSIKNSQQHFLSPPQKSRIEDPTLDDFIEMNSPESILAKRSEQVNATIDNLFALNKQEELDLKPSKQQSFGEIKRNRKSTAQTSLRSMIHQKENSIHMVPSLTPNELLAHPSIMSNSYAPERKPIIANKIPSPQNEYIPTKDTLKNEYNIDEYLPKKNLLSIENHRSNSSLDSGFQSKVTKLELSTLLPDQSNLKRPETSFQRSQNLNSTNFVEIRSPGAVPLETFNQSSLKKLSEQDLKLSESQNTNKEAQLKSLFGNILATLGLVKNPEQVASELVKTIVHSSGDQQDNRLKEDYMSSIQKFTNSSGVEVVSRGCQTLEKSYDYSRIPRDRQFARSESDPRFFQTAFGKKEFGRVESPNLKEVSHISASEIKRNYRTDSKDFQGESMKKSGGNWISSPNKKNFQESRTVLGSIENANPSATKKWNKSSFAGENNVIYEGKEDYINEKRANLENAFLENLNQTHEKFSSHLKKKVQNFKKENKPAENVEQGSTIKKSRFPSMSSNFSPSGKYFQSSFLNIADRNQRETQLKREEEKSITSPTSLKFISPTKTFDLSSQRSQSQKWMNMKFFEDEDLDLLIKSYI